MEEKKRQGARAVYSAAFGLLIGCRLACIPLVHLQRTFYATMGVRGKALSCHVICLSEIGRILALN